VKKIIFISFFNFLLIFNTTSFAKTFYIGDEVNNVFDFNRYIKINLDSDNWEVVRANTSNWGVLQRIVGIARVENNEIMEMIEIYEGLLAGYYIGHVNPILTELVFKDKHDGCYERPEYYLLKLYRKGSTFNCMIVRHMDVTKELNSPDGPQGKAAASAYNYWIKKKSLNYPKIMLESHHTYFSRLTGGTWHTVKRFINPKLLNAPQSKFFSEETSEYHKLNISQFPDHQQTMSKWISLSSQFQKEFEEMVKSKKRHRLNLDQYIDSNIAIKSDNLITDQLKKLNDLYKSGVLTREEFEKAKKKILN
jgi:hypothetical protein